MEYPLKQYGCSRCGALSDVLDVDAQLPQGWIIGGPLTHFCPYCAVKVRERVLELRRAGYSASMIAARIGARIGDIDEVTVEEILNKQD